MHTAHTVYPEYNSVATLRTSDADDADIHSVSVNALSGHTTNTSKLYINLTYKFVFIVQMRLSHQNRNGISEFAYNVVVIVVKVCVWHILFGHIQINDLLHF